MVEIISYGKVTAHERLTERLDSLLGRVATACGDAADLPAGPLMVTLAAALLSDIYRLVSREPGARSLARLDPRQRPTHRALRTMLRDARLALDMFAWNHRDHDEDTADEWLTWEGIDDFRASRRKLVPLD